MTLRGVVSVKTASLAACAALLLAPAAAIAGEARIAAVAHDIDGLDAGVSGKESGAAIGLEYMWESPDFLDILFSPRPYIGGNIHLQGKTSFVGGGLTWRGDITGRFYIDGSFGLVVHDGETELPGAEVGLPDEENQRRIRANAENIEFGSRVLFREQVALGVRVTESWAAEIFYEHLSHGNILDDGSNEGLDNAGLRLSRRF